MNSIHESLHPAFADLKQGDAHREATIRAAESSSGLLPLLLADIARAADRLQRANIGVDRLVYEVLPAEWQVLLQFVKAQNGLAADSSLDTLIACEFFGLTIRERPAA